MRASRGTMRKLRRLVALSLTVIVGGTQTGCVCEIIGGCDLDLGLPPEILRISPQEGVPGTEVTLQGLLFSSPCDDPTAVVNFGDIEIVPQAALAACTGQEVNAADIDPVNGVIKKWDGKEIVFTTPLANLAQEQEVPISISLNGGELISNEVVFTTKLCANPPCNPPQTNAFVGAVIASGLDEIHYLNLRRDGNIGDSEANRDPSLSILPFDEQPADDPVGRVPFGADGFDTEAHDIRIDSQGGALITLSLTPQQDTTDGLHAAAYLAGYVEAEELYEVQVRPRRLVSNALGGAAGDNRAIAILSEGAATVDVRTGGDYGNSRQFHLLDNGPDARPSAGIFLTASDGSTNRILVAGHSPLSGTSWTSLILRDSGTVIGVPELSFAGVIPVDVVRHRFFEDPVSEISDIYVAYNSIVSGESSFIARLRLDQGTGTTDVSRLNMPAGIVIKSMLIDSTAGFSAGFAPQSVPQLWFSADDQGEGDDDFVGAIRLASNTFPAGPGAVSDYADWTAWLDAELLEAANAFTEVAGFTDALTTGASTEQRNAVTAPVGGYFEVRNNEDGTRLVEDPFGLTLLPGNTEDRMAPTFLLVSNTGGNNVLAIRTDGANVVDRRPITDTTDGFVWGDLVLPGEEPTPTRIYCVDSLLGGG